MRWASTWPMNDRLEAVAPGKKVDKYSYRASRKEIQENDYNLNVCKRT